MSASSGFWADAWRHKWRVALGLFTLAFFVSFFFHGEVCEPAKYRYFDECSSHRIPYVVWSFIDVHNGVVVAIATVFVAGFTIVLARIGKQQADILSAQTAMALATQRAFVSIQCKGPIQTPPTLRFSFDWHNSGETPTKDFVAIVRSKIHDTELPETFAFEDGVSTEYIPSMVAPKANIPHTSPFEADQTAALLGGKYFCYVWGWAEYNDVFVGTPRHRTEFCFRVIAFTHRDGSTGYNFITHRQFNAADGECLYPVKTLAERIPPKKA